LPFWQSKIEYYLFNNSSGCVSFNHEFTRLLRAGKETVNNPRDFV